MGRGGGGSHHTCTVLMVHIPYTESLGPEDTQHIPHTGTRGHTTHPSHWDQRTHNTSLTLGPEDTQHIPYTGTRGHTTHPSHWDQRTHNTSLTLGPEDTQHIPYIGTRGHTTHHLHWDQRTHTYIGTRGHTTHPLHWDQRDWFIFLVTGLITFTGTAAGLLLPRLQLGD